MQNNIFYVRDGLSQYLFADRGGSFMEINNNLYYGNGEGPGEGMIDINARNGKPLFVDPENGNYNLQTDSPGLDAGMTIDLRLEPDLNGVINDPAYTVM